MARVWSKISKTSPTPPLDINLSPVHLWWISCKFAPFTGLPTSLQLDEDIAIIFCSIRFVIIPAKLTF